MKKYRFRGKHNGKWVYGRLTYKLVELEMGTAAIDAIIDENYEVYAVPPDTVGQSIGKHDKKGNEIFTGDVIRDTLPNGDTHDFVIDYWAVFSEAFSRTRERSSSLWLYNNERCCKHAEPRQCCYTNGS